MNDKGLRNSKASRWEVMYCLSGSLILLITGLAKLHSALLGHNGLSVIDPLLGIPIGVALLIAGFLEAVVALFGFCKLPICMRTTALVWLGSCFLTYRGMTLITVGNFKYCNCLGSLPKVLGFSLTTANWISTAAALYLTVPGIALIYLRSNRRGPAGA